MAPSNGRSDRLRCLKLSRAGCISRTRNRWVHHDHRDDARDLFPGHRELFSHRGATGRLRGARREGATSPAPLPPRRTAKASEGRRPKRRRRRRRTPLSEDQALSGRPPLLKRDVIRSRRPPCVKDLFGFAGAEGCCRRIAPARGRGLEVGGSTSKFGRGRGMSVTACLSRLPAPPTAALTEVNVAASAYHRLEQGLVSVLHDGTAFHLCTEQHVSPAAQEREPRLQEPRNDRVSYADRQEINWQEQRYLGEVPQAAGDSPQCRMPFPPVSRHAAPCHRPVLQDETLSRRRGLPIEGESRPDRT